VWLQREDGTRAILPAGQASRFQVFVTDTLKIAEGDRISVTKNGQAEVGESGKSVRINNGEIFTVEGFTKRGDIRLSDGKVLDKRYGHWNFGYVETSYSAQGKTVDRVFIATGNESLAATGKQQWYVSVSRGREACKVYVDSKDDVRDAIAKKGERLSAVELMSQQPKERQSIYATLMERNRLWRFVKERAAAIAESVRSRTRTPRMSPPREGMSYDR
jgi:ATP-dependent exoDNAse (exonuclease V) alpha subunit